MGPLAVVGLVSNILGGIRARKGKDPGIFGTISSVAGAADTAGAGAAEPTKSTELASALDRAKSASTGAPGLISPVSRAGLTQMASQASAPPPRPLMGPPAGLAGAGPNPNRPFSLAGPSPAPPQHAPFAAAGPGLPPGTTDPISLGGMRQPSPYELMARRFGGMR